MKLIESGELIDYRIKKRMAFLFKDIELPQEAAVTYLAEVKPCINPNTDTVIFEVTVLGKKQDYICSECGNAFISHKGMCSNCYVRQL